MSVGKDKVVKSLTSFLSEAGWKVDAGEDLTFVYTRQYTMPKIKKCIELQVHVNSKAYNIDDAHVVVLMPEGSELVLQVCPQADCQALDYACAKWAAVLDYLYEKYDGISLAMDPADPRLTLEVTCVNQMDALSPAATAELKFSSKFFFIPEVVTSTGGIRQTTVVHASYDS